MRFPSLHALLALSPFVLSLASAALCPVPSSALRLPKDAEYTLSNEELLSKLTCVNGLENTRKPFLLVPGTGNTGEQSWGTGYVKLLTLLGYDVCYVSPPPFMLDDIQTNAEYIAKAYEVLFERTCTSFPVMGWSQGNLALQWVLTFWPSTRRKTLQFISLAGDFRGTAEGPFIVALQLGNAAKSVTQQSIPSNFLTALQAKGGSFAWVPTTSIFSRTDEVIQPQLDNSFEGSTSFLGNAKASNVFVQDFCPLLSILHGEQLYANFSYQVVLLALSSPTRIATTRQILAANIPCTNDAAPPLTPEDVANLQASFLFAGAVVLAPPPEATMVGEPPLRDYVARFPDNPVHD